MLLRVSSKAPQALTNQEYGRGMSFYTQLSLLCPPSSSCTDEACHHQISKSCCREVEQVSLFQKQQQEESAGISAEEEQRCRQQAPRKADCGMDI